MTAETAPRIPPLEAPYPEGIAELLARMTPPQAPEVLALFRVLAVNPRLAERTLELGRHFLGRKASISLRERELVILRVCARCGAEYEWGVHWSGFADAAGLARPSGGRRPGATRTCPHCSRATPCCCAWSTSCTTRATSTMRCGMPSAGTGTTRSVSS